MLPKMPQFTENQKACIVGGLWDPESDQPCPDARHPENYIRALESLPSRLGWSIARDWQRVAVRIWSEAGMIPIFQQRPSGTGETVIAALAALYDQMRSGTGNEKP